MAEKVFFNGPVQTGLIYVRRCFGSNESVCITTEANVRGDEGAPEPRDSATQGSNKQTATGTGTVVVLGIGTSSEKSAGVAE